MKQEIGGIVWGKMQNKNAFFSIIADGIVTVKQKERDKKL